MIIKDQSPDLVDTLPIISNLLATKIVEVVELNRIISVKSDQLEWVADAALKGALKWH